MKLEETFSLLADFLFPPRCVFCNTVIPSGDQVCRGCEGNIRCVASVKYMNVPEIGKTIRCTVPYLYSDAVREAIIRFKFQNQKELAPFFSEKMSEQVRSCYRLAEIDWITSVPISAERLKTRGYNQSKLLSEEMAVQLGIPYHEFLLKTADNREQHKLSEKERRENVLGVYKPVQAETFAGKSILLIDDIVTTGATLCECAKVLFQNGAKDVACAAIAEVEV